MVVWSSCIREQWRQPPSGKPDLDNSSVLFSPRRSQVVSTWQIKQSGRFRSNQGFHFSSFQEHFPRVPLCLESISRFSEAPFVISASSLMSPLRPHPKQLLAGMFQQRTAARLIHKRQNVFLMGFWESEVSALVSNPNIVFYVSLIGLPL